jgi:hypothetical protein
LRPAKSKNAHAASWEQWRMAAFKLNLKINQGATFRKVITWKAGTPALPVDLTGCTARMQMRGKITDAAFLLELTTENGGIALGGVLGTITLNITAAQTTLIAWKSAIYDLEIVYADATVRRLLAGSVSVSPEVTRG